MNPHYFVSSGQIIVPFFKQMFGEHIVLSAQALTFLPFSSNQFKAISEKMC